MAQEVAIPRLGWGMEKGTFVEWRKHHGEGVEEGEVLFVMEGDKATQEIEALARGMLHVVPSAPAPGDEVAVGRVIAYLLAPGEEPPGEPASPPISLPTSASPPPSPRPGRAAVAPRPGRRVAASPRARRVARELGVEVSALAGSGTSGRVTERDVRAASRRPSAQSWSVLGVEVDARLLADLAARVAAGAGGSPARAAVLTALLVRLCAAAAATLFPGRSIGVGVARAGAGALEWLAVPAAERLSVLELARHLEAPPAAAPIADMAAAALRVLDAASLGVDSYEPGAEGPGSPLLVFNRPRGTDGRSSVTLRVLAGAAHAREASVFLSRVREALEAPDLWLAR